MKEIQFINKVWISEKGIVLDRILNICCWIYSLLVLVVIVMEGIQLETMITFAAAIIIIIWTHFHSKRTGHYIQAECKISFSKNKIVWEYPNINMPAYKGTSSIKYTIDASKIINVSISSEINSLRLECLPLVEYKGQRKHKIIDFSHRREACVLIIYNYNLDTIKSLFDEYINVKIDIVD